MCVMLNSRSYEPELPIILIFVAVNGPTVHCNVAAGCCVWMMSAWPLTFMLVEAANDNCPEWGCDMLLLQFCCCCCSCCCCRCHTVIIITFGSHDHHWLTTDAVTDRLTECIHRIQPNSHPSIHPSILPICPSACQSVIPNRQSPSVRNIWSLSVYWIPLRKQVNFHNCCVCCSLCWKMLPSSGFCCRSTFFSVAARIWVCYIRQCVTM